MISKLWRCACTLSFPKFSAFATQIQPYAKPAQVGFPKFPPVKKMSLLNYLSRERKFEEPQLEPSEKITSMIKKEGFEILHGTEGKYDKLVKITKEFIVEIVFFPRKRKARVDLKAFNTINSIIREEALAKILPPVMPIRDVETKQKKKPRKELPDLPKVFKDDVELEPLTFYVNLTNKANQTLVFQCHTEGEGVYLAHVQFVPKNGLNYVNEPVFARTLNKYKGPLFYHLSVEMQERLLNVLRENSVVPEVGLWISYLALYSEEKKYIEWLGDVHKYFSEHNV